MASKNDRDVAGFMAVELAILRGNLIEQQWANGVGITNTHTIHLHDDMVESFETFVKEHAINRQEIVDKYLPEVARPLLDNMRFHLKELTTEEANAYMLKNQLKREKGEKRQ